MMMMMMMMMRHSGQVQQHKASLILCRHIWLSLRLTLSTTIQNNCLHSHTESLLPNLRARSQDAAAIACNKKTNSEFSVIISSSFSAHLSSP